MSVAQPRQSSCRIYLITPPLSVESAPTFKRTFAQVLAAAPIASARVQFAPNAEGEAKIIRELLELAHAADCALVLDGDPRQAIRLKVDGVHVEGVGGALEAALNALKPERFVGVGGLRSRDDAMTAGERGADYVMFGAPGGSESPIAFELLLERVAWWAEIFETPCVAYARTLAEACRLAAAGADFVAIDNIWREPSPSDAVNSLSIALSE